MRYSVLDISSIFFYSHVFDSTYVRHFDPVWSWAPPFTNGEFRASGAAAHLSFGSPLN